MPHITSAKKRLRQNKVRRQRNRAVLGDLRTSIKKLLKNIKDGKVAESRESLATVFGKLDKCAMRRYLHPNTAHRYKSRLNLRVNKLEQGSAGK